MNRSFDTVPATFSLRKRLTVWLALAVIVAVGGAAWVVDWRVDADMSQRFDAALLARAQALAALVQVEDGKVDIDNTDKTAWAVHGAADRVVYDLRCGGRLLARSGELPLRASTNARPRIADVRVNGRLLRMATLRFDPVAEGHNGAEPAVQHCELRYALERASLDSMLQSIDVILLGSLLGACVLVLLATPWLVRRGLQPLTVLSGAMAKIGPDTPGGRLPAGHSRELAPLVARFNEVLERMDAGLQRERQFASGLAHEFRTRLAELRVLVEVEIRCASGRDMTTVLGEVGSIGAELEATVSALLQLTRIQSGLEQTRLEPVALDPTLTRVLARHGEVARTRSVHFQMQAEPDAESILTADPVLLEIVLDNLIGNAVAYAPTGTTIAVDCAACSVCVANQAPELQASDLANLGQRFWRKHAQGTGHAGLGLALASAAALALRMTLAFELRDGSLRASLRWSS
ncbi:MAG: sensor histidine kinase N-terminal domain-containing protein [Proteobacteria bacterium]|nr:sensor histidine kinase N-terminal domain-containing protein [Pseudomonadota bacterium]MBS0463730.1 sensor histidine kinase N-terminal domain-containing protein [Pseudomonadota bacterium]